MERCHDDWTGCRKLIFHDENEAWAYAEYLEQEHGYYVHVYWDAHCECYHFTSSDPSKRRRKR